MTTRPDRFPLLLIAGVGVLCFGLVGAIVWDRDFRRASGKNPGTQCPMVVRATQRNPLAAFGVHRVALIGDSIMVQPSCAIAESLAGVGITTSRDAVSGSGLLNGGVDWLATTRFLLKAE